MNIIKCNRSTFDIPKDSPTELWNGPYTIPNFESTQFLIDNHPIKVSPYNETQIRITSPDYLGLSKFWLGLQYGGFQTIEEFSGETEKNKYMAIKFNIESIIIARKTILAEIALEYRRRTGNNDITMAEVTDLASSTTDKTMEDIKKTMMYEFSDYNKLGTLLHKYKYILSKTKQTEANLEAFYITRNSIDYIFYLLYLMKNYPIMCNYFSYFNNEDYISLYAIKIVNINNPKHQNLNNIWDLCIKSEINNNIILYASMKWKKIIKNCKNDLIVIALLLLDREKKFDHQGILLIDKKRKQAIWLETNIIEKKEATNKINEIRNNLCGQFIKEVAPNYEFVGINKKCAGIQSKNIELKLPIEEIYERYGVHDFKGFCTLISILQVEEILKNYNKETNTKSLKTVIDNIVLKFAKEIDKELTKLAESNEIEKLYKEKEYFYNEQIINYTIKKNKESNNYKEGEKKFNELDESMKEQINNYEENYDTIIKRVTKESQEYLNDTYNKKSIVYIILNMLFNQDSDIILYLNYNTENNKELIERIKKSIKIDLAKIYWIKIRLRKFTLFKREIAPIGSSQQDIKYFIIQYIKQLK